MGTKHLYWILTSPSFAVYSWILCISTCNWLRPGSAGGRGLPLRQELGLKAVAQSRPLPPGPTPQPVGLQEAKYNVVFILKF